MHYRDAKINWLFDFAYNRKRGFMCTTSYQKKAVHHFLQEVLACDQLIFYACYSINGGEGDQGVTILCKFF